MVDLEIRGYCKAVGCESEVSGWGEGPRASGGQMENGRVELMRPRQE